MAEPLPLMSHSIKKMLVVNWISKTSCLNADFIFIGKNVYLYVKKQKPFLGSNL